MGWASGTYVMESIINELWEIVPDVNMRALAYKGIIKALQLQDWDCESEPAEDDGHDPAYKMALRDVERESGHWEAEWEDENDEYQSEACPQLTCPRCPHSECWFKDVPEIQGKKESAS